MFIKTLHGVNKFLGTDGGFTDWSEIGSCTKPCGKGVKIETRTCTNPKPSFNGRDCSGETKRLNPYFCNSQVSSKNMMIIIIGRYDGSVFGRLEVVARQ